METTICQISCYKKTPLKTGFKPVFLPIYPNFGVNVNGFGLRL